MKNALDTAKLSTMVRTKRGSSGLRAIAAELGNEVSPSTLSRIENGKVPDMETFLLLCDWLDVPAAELFAGSERTLSTGEEIAILIRADSRLDPATATVLAVLVEVAYRKLRGKEGAPKITAARRRANFTGLHPCRASPCPAVLARRSCSCEASLKTVVRLLSHSRLRERSAA